MEHGSAMGEQRHGEAGKSWEKKVWDTAIDFVHHDVNPEKGLSHEINTYVSNPECFMDAGGAGKVFDLDNHVCIKMMHNRHTVTDREKYNLGNSPDREAHIQNMLRDFVVDGVFVPHIVGYYAGKESAAIVMEKLDAVNLQAVFNKKASLPKTFNAEKFVDSLYEFVEAMHQQFGIIHNDLEPRNVMIDTKTGQARVIDFGRSLLASEIDDAVKVDRLKDGELDKIEAIETKLETLLAVKAA